MLYRIIAYSSFLFVASFMLNFSVVACPKIDKLIDYNCDEACKITVTGDSIVKGVRDITYVDGGNDVNGGGYVARIETVFPECRVNNLGIPGITSEGLIRAFKKRLGADGTNVTKQRTYKADIIIVDLGRNDYWIDRGKTPEKTAANIKRLINYIKSKYKQKNYDQPYFVVPRLLQTARSFQNPFIIKLNKEFSRLSLPAGPDLSKLQPSYIISTDGIHPDSRGYDSVARAMIRYIKTTVQSAMKKNLPDVDSDKVYDKYEKKKFSTDPSLFDTDGDGVSDGIEIFEYHSDPLDPNSFSPIATPSPTQDPSLVTPTATPSPTPTETATPTATPTV